MHFCVAWRGVAFDQPPETMRQSDEPTDRERCEMEIIKSLMRSYFDIARKNFQVSYTLAMGCLVKRVLSWTLQLPN